MPQPLWAHSFDGNLHVQVPLLYLTPMCIHLLSWKELLCDCFHRLLTLSLHPQDQTHSQFQLYLHTVLVWTTISLWPLLSHDLVCQSEDSPESQHVHLLWQLHNEKTQELKSWISNHGNQLMLEQSNWMWIKTQELLPLSSPIHRCLLLL